MRSASNDQKSAQKIRLDKWLWAARFFKTRSLCKTAIDGGKVQYVSAEQKTQRVKANKIVNVGDIIEVRQGWDSKIVIVDGLSEQRSKAVAAALLYHETEDSITKREKNTLLRQSARDSVVFDNKKPDKRDRRRIFRFNENNNS
jgi:ribosome-associated heat shock protein Hsp15